MTGISGSTSCANAAASSNSGRKKVIGVPVLATIMQTIDMNPRKGTDSSQTHRWREVDSNFWSLSTLMPLVLAK
jgi:hypothetical protein